MSSVGKRPAELTAADALEVLQKAAVALRRASDEYDAGHREWEAAKHRLDETSNDYMAARRNYQEAAEAYDAYAREQGNH